MDDEIIEIHGFAMVDNFGRFLFFIKDSTLCDFIDLTEVKEGDDIIIFNSPKREDIVYSLVYRKVVPDLSSIKIDFVEIIKYPKEGRFVIL